MASSNTGIVVIGLILFFISTSLFFIVIAIINWINDKVNKNKGIKIFFKDGDNSQLNDYERS